MWFKSWAWWYTPVVLATEDWSRRITWPKEFKASLVARSYSHTRKMWFGGKSIFAILISVLADLWLTYIDLIVHILFFLWWKHSDLLSLELAYVDSVIHTNKYMHTTTLVHLSFFLTSFLEFKNVSLLWSFWHSSVWKNITYKVYTEFFFFFWY